MLPQRAADDAAAASPSERAKAAGALLMTSGLRARPLALPTRSDQPRNPALRQDLFALATAVATAQL